MDPSTVPNYREAAGLPSGGASEGYNAGRFVSVGIVSDPCGVEIGSALSVDNNPGGLAQFWVPDPRTQITLLGVYGANPAF